MKNVFLLAVALICAVQGFSQKVINFTTSATDTLWVPESNVIRVTKTTGGSELEYVDYTGDYASTAVRERSYDTANVASTVTITFSGTAGSVDSITINGVEILTDTVGFTTNITTTVGLVEDSIDNNTQSPVNYTATFSDSVLTISAPTAFGDTANGYTVVVYTRGGITADPSTTSMTGGFTVVRNIITLSTRLFNLDSGADGCINADRVISIKQSNGDSQIWYDGVKFRTVSTSDNAATITTAINGL